MGTLINPFSHGFSRADFFVVNVAVLVNRFNELGRYTVPAGMGLALGFGQLSGQDSAAGRIFADIRNDAAAPGAVINGVLRFDIHSPQDFVEKTLYQERTENLRTTLADRSIQVPLPVVPDVIGEDWALVLKFRPDVAGTVGAANTVILVSATKFEVR